MTQPPQSGPQPPQWGPPPPQWGPPPPQSGPPPPQSGPPPPQWGPQPPQWGPQPPQWGPPHRGPSRRKVWLVVAGAGVLIAVIVVVVAGQHPGQPAPSGQKAAAPSGASAPSGQNAPSDPNDDQYIEKLAQHNITGDQADLINDAHQICAKIRAGKDTMSSLSTWYMYQSGFSNKDAGWVIGQAIASYCPDQAGFAFGPFGGLK
jgi:hypothetical protein